MVLFGTRKSLYRNLKWALSHDDRFFAPPESCADHSKKGSFAGLNGVAATFRFSILKILFVKNFYSRFCINIRKRARKACSAIPSPQHGTQHLVPPTTTVRHTTPRHTHTDEMAVFSSNRPFHRRHCSRSVLFSDVHAPPACALTDPSASPQHYETQPATHRDGRGGTEHPTAIINTYAQAGIKKIGRQNKKTDNLNIITLHFIIS